MNFWKRYISFTIGDRVYADPFSLTFNSGFSMSGNQDTSARIYNPSAETVELVRPKGKIVKTYQPITIDAGFKDDHGVCVIGEIFDYNVSSSGQDSILELKIQDTSAAWANLKTNRTWQSYASSYTIILELALMFGLGIGKIEPGINKIYTRGLSSNKSLKEELKQLAKETESYFFIRNQKIYFLSKYGIGIKTGVSLSHSTGLIGKPSESKGGLKLRSLFNYKIGPGEYVHVESEKYNSDYRVMSGSHSYTDEQAETEMTLEEV